MKTQKENMGRKTPNGKASYNVASLKMEISRLGINTSFPPPIQSDCIISNFLKPSIHLTQRAVQLKLHKRFH
jgi:hypothetical protein